MGIPDDLTLLPVTGCGQDSDDAVALVDCLFLAVDVDVDDEAMANEARRSSTENMVERSARP